MYTLENAEDSYRQNPSQICIPRLEERQNLAVGEAVKIGVIPENGSEAERVWVRVAMIRGGRYMGDLLESPKTVPSLAAGYKIDFLPENVWQIYIDENDWRWYDGSKYAMVSHQMIEQNAWPGRLMRIPPADDRYSGWFILKGDEDRHYMRDLSNFTPFLLSDCVNRCAVLASILFTEVGADWVWDEANQEYIAYKTPKLGPV